MHATLPFEVVMASNDIIKAKKKVEHSKTSIRYHGSGPPNSGAKTNEMPL